MNKIKVRCVSANMTNPPKPNGVVQYRFIEVDPPSGKEGELFIEGGFGMYLTEKSPFNVGDDYVLVMELA